MNPQSILVVAVVIVMGWFAYGVIYNIRHGEALLKWLQTGLPEVGQRTTFRWLGTSVAELVIARAKNPFRRLETLLVLKPRDIFWMTMSAYFQGREDIIIFRGQLNIPSRVDLELADPKTWTGRSALRQMCARNWAAGSYKEMQLMTPPGLLEMAASLLARIAPRMERLSARFIRFSLRREGSYFEIHVPFPAFRSIDAVQYVNNLRDLAAAISERE